MRAKEFAESLEGIVSSFWFLLITQTMTKGQVIYLCICVNPFESCYMLGSNSWEVIH